MQCMHHTHFYANNKLNSDEKNVGDIRSVQHVERITEQLNTNQFRPNNLFIHFYAHPY